jgi:dynein intermediate chain
MSTDDRIIPRCIGAISANSPAMDRRRAELEEKRRKLEEMKRAREERMSATAALRKSVAPATSTRETAQTPYRGNNRQQVDDLLNNILGQSTPSAPSASRPGSSLSASVPRTPAPLYRNQGVQDTQETIPESTTGVTEREEQAQQPSVLLQ